MRNQQILVGYLVFFFLVVSSYEIYKENTIAVAIAGLLLVVIGFLAWLWSVQPPKDKPPKDAP